MKQARRLVVLIAIVAAVSSLAPSASAAVRINPNCGQVQAFHERFSFCLFMQSGNGVRAVFRFWDTPDVCPEPGRECDVSSVNVRSLRLMGGYPNDGYDDFPVARIGSNGRVSVYAGGTPEAKQYGHVETPWADVGECYTDQRSGSGYVYAFVKFRVRFDVGDYPHDAPRNGYYRRHTTAASEWTCTP
jgi:hypothetical protein